MKGIPFLVRGKNHFFIPSPLAVSFFPSLPPSKRLETALNSVNLRLPFPPSIYSISSTINHKDTPLENVRQDHSPFSPPIIHSNPPHHIYQNLSWRVPRRVKNRQIYHLRDSPPRFQLSSSVKNLLSFSLSLFLFLFLTREIEQRVGVSLAATICPTSLRESYSISRAEEESPRGVS